MNLLPDQGPMVVHAFNLLDRRQQQAFRAQPGLTLDQLRPMTRQPVVCIFNGCPVLAEDMDYVPRGTDHAIYVVLPMGGGNVSQAVLGIVLIVVGFIVPGAQGLIYVGVGLLISGLMPQPNYAPLGDIAQTQAPSQTYNLETGGNNARLGGAIPVLYGRHILVPDFVSQPYVEWHTDNNQFYHALFCIGANDSIEIESIQIDDTIISHFEGVETDVIVAGSNRNTALLYDVIVNAAEVANQDLLRGQYAGPFAVCGPGNEIVGVSVDVRMPRGLYYAADNGALGPKTVSWFVEARRINDLNVAIGPWRLLALEELTLTTNTPQARTYTYGLVAVGGVGRYEVRLSRQDERDSNVRAGHDLQWAGMRGLFTTDMPDDRCNYLAVRMKATSQLSGLSQRKFALILKAKLPTWSPEGGWAEPTHTRSIAWAAADILRNPKYGVGLPDFRIDLQSLYELDQVWSERGDQFNGVFDKRVTAWAALTAVLRAGRARPIMRGSVVTFVRDQKQDLPVALFSMRNIEKGSFQSEYLLRSEDESDGLELDYYDANSWSTKTVVVPLNEEDSPEDIIQPQRMTLMGSTNEAQTMREARYIVADSKFRRQRITFTTELEGYLPAFGDLIAVSHDLTGWGVSGEFEDYDDVGQIAWVNEDLPWGDGTFYAVIVGSQGDVFGPYRVVPGPEKRTMMFMDPVETNVYIGTERERTRYSMGVGEEYAKFCRVTALTPKDNLRVQISAVVEDNRVHTADEGVPPDPGTGGEGGRRGLYAPDDVPVYNNASEEQQAKYAFYSTDAVTVGSPPEQGYVYAPD